MGAFGKGEGMSWCVECCVDVCDETISERSWYSILGDSLCYCRTISGDRTRIDDKSNRFCIIKMFPELIPDSRMAGNINNTYRLLGRKSH